jgi:VWFA-related protein
MVNTPFAGQAQARRVLLETLSKFVDDGQPKSLVLFTQAGVRVVHDFTSDPESLAQALRRVLSNSRDVTNQKDFVKDPSLYQRLADFTQPTHTEYADFRQRMSVQSSVECFREIAKAFSGVPGRKTLIWATAGFPYTGATGVYPDYEKTWRTLNAANVSIYPIDIREMRIPGFDMGRRPSQQSYSSPIAGIYGPRAGVSQQSWQEQESATMLNFARETGGKSCIGRPDLSECFQDAIVESGSFYMIGYYLNHVAAKPGWHKLEVKTRLDGMKVRARSGFEVTASTPNTDLKTAIETAVVSPLDYTAVPISAKWIGTAREKGVKKEVSFALFLPAGAFDLDEQDGNRMDLELIAVARQPNGEAIMLRDIELQDHFTVPEANKIKSDGFEFHNSLELASGDYNIRFLIRDALSGKIGTLTTPLKIE